MNHYSVGISEHPLHRDRLHFINEAAVSSYFPEYQDILPYLESIAQTPDKEAGWILRFCVRFGVIWEKEDWSHLYHIIASVSGQKAGWALDNAIERGFVTQEDFPYFFGLIASVSGQKAGWALDNAIERGFVTQEDFLVFIDNILLVPYQKLGFALRNGFEKGWVTIEDIFQIFQKSKHIPGQSLGWVWRHIIKNGQGGDKINMSYIISELSLVAGQEVGWLIDILAEKGNLDGQILLDSTKIIAPISGQCASWALRGLGKFDSQIHAVLRDTPGQSYGWHLRRMVYADEISAPDYRESLEKIHTIPGQEPWWAVDVGFEKGFLNEYFFNFYIKTKLTLNSRSLEWVILYFFNNQIPFVHLQDLLIRDPLGNAYNECIVTLKYIANRKLIPINLLIIINNLIRKGGRGVGIILAYCIEHQLLQKSDIEPYILLSKGFHGKEWFILAMIRSGMFDEMTIRKNQNMKHPLIVLGMIEKGWLERSEFQDFEISFPVKIPEDYLILDRVSQKGWIHRSQYQPFFTFDDI